MLWLPVGSDFSLDNTNVNPLDIDSDGIVEFLHMPHLRSYAGILAIFDRRSEAAPLPERTSLSTAATASGRTVTLLRG